MEIIDRSDPDVSFEGTGARFNTVLKTGPKIDPKTVPNSLFFGFLALLFEGFFGTLLGTIFGTVFGTVLNRGPESLRAGRCEGLGHWRARGARRRQRCLAVGDQESRDQGPNSNKKILA